MTHDEDRFAEQARQAVAAAADQLDPDTRRRLTQARYAALDALPRARWHRWRYAIAGLTSATAMLLVVSLWLMAPATTPVPEQLADLELLATSDNPDFFNELEFYQWLADDQAS